MRSHTLSIIKVISPSRLAREVCLLARQRKYLADVHSCFLHMAYLKVMRHDLTRSKHLRPYKAIGDLDSSKTPERAGKTFCQTLEATQMSLKVTCRATFVLLFLVLLVLECLDVLSLLSLSKEYHYAQHDY